MPITRISRSLALGLLALAAPVLGAAEWTLSGPLIVHDPTIVREGDVWWCFYTGGGLPCKSSTNGVDWTQRTNHFMRELPWWREWAPKMDAIDVWAPDVSEFNGRFWLYYSVSEFGKNNSAIGLVSCTSILKGDWRDEGLVIGSKAGKQGYNAIDPNLVVDAEGKPWLAFGSWFTGLCVVPLDPATMKPAGTPVTIAHREAGIEGPSLVYRDGYYYLFAAIDKCCLGLDSTYKTVIGRSKAITGPYLDKEGKDMMEGAGTLFEAGGGRWVGPGHGRVCNDGSSWIWARHAYDAKASGKPMLRIADLYWDEAGWPSLEKPLHHKVVVQ